MTNQSKPRKLTKTKANCEYKLNEVTNEKKRSNLVTRQR